MKLCVLTTIPKSDNKISPNDDDDESVPQKNEKQRWIQDRRPEKNRVGDVKNQ